MVTHNMPVYMPFWCQLELFHVVRTIEGDQSAIADLLVRACILTSESQQIGSSSFSVGSPMMAQKRKN